MDIYEIVNNINISFYYIKLNYFYFCQYTNIM